MSKVTVGIDISKDWFDASWLSGENLCTQRFDYTQAGMEAFLEATPAGAVYVMEATGIYHARLALRLFEADRAVSVVNPLVIKRYGQMQLRRAKNDPQDAQLIRQYGEAERPSPWRPDSEEIQELEQAHGWLNDMIVERTRLINRQKAQAYRARPSAFVREQMQAQMDQLEARIKACEDHLETLVKKAFSRLYDNLRSIPAIGSKTALELLVITDGFTRFDDAKALSAYVGVSPSTFQSGSSVRGTGKTIKLGGGRIRQLLYVCSWTAKKNNPACKRLHDRLRSAGKPMRVINVAIAHKLLRQAFAVATQNRPFSAEYA